MNLEAYTQAHSTLALVDASLLSGRVRATGPDAIDLLHRMSTNDLTPLIAHEGKGAQTVLTTEKGRIVDLLNILATDNGALIVTGREREEIVINWLDKFVIMEDAKFTNASTEIFHFLLFGPVALTFLLSQCSAEISSLQNFESLTSKIDGITVRIQRSHRIIESGFSIFVDAQYHDELFASLRSSVEAVDGAVVDSDTFDTIRIEAGIPIAPNELNEKHNPLETTLVQAISWTKGCYIGQEVIARLDSFDKVQRHLMGVQFASNIQADVPFALQTTDGVDIGEVTSLTESPSLGTSIGLAFVKTAFANPKAVVKANNFEATLVKLPFDIES